MWTLGEIDALIGEFLDPGQKLAVVLGKFSRQVKAESMFDKAVQSNFYIKKF